MAAVRQSCLDIEDIRHSSLQVLARYLGLPSSAMIEKALEMLRREARGETGAAYERFFRRKKSGGKREIRAPREPIKTLTRIILKEVLDRWPLGPYAHGFRARRSIITNARTHLAAGARYATNWDIEKCFPSTEVWRIRQVYRQTVGFDMSVEGLDRTVVEEVIEVLCRLATLRYGRASTEVLPMGSPTSPALLNLVLHPFDLHLASRLMRISLEQDAPLTYTRYGDDLTISSPTPLPDKLEQVVPNLLRSSGYRVNPGKTQRMRMGSSRRPIKVTGLILGADRLLLPDGWVKKTEQMINRYALSVREPAPDELRVLRGRIGLARAIYGGDLPGRLRNLEPQLEQTKSFPFARERAAAVFAHTGEKESCLPYYHEAVPDRHRSDPVLFEDPFCRETDLEDDPRP